MVACDACGRHVREEASCPFCGAGRSAGSALAKARNLAGVALTAIVLSACYGTGVTDKTLTTDTDGSGETGDTAQTTP